MASQTAWEAIDVLAKGKKHPPHLFKPESLILLPILIAISLAVLFVTFAIPPVYRKIRDWVSPPQYDLLVDEDEEPEPLTPDPHMPSGGLVSDLKLHIRSLREYGSVLVLWEVVRLLAIAALLGLSIYAAIQAEPPQDSHRSFDITKHKKKKHKNHHDKLILGEYTPLELGEFGTTAFYAYTLILSFMLLALKPATPIRRQLIAHLDIFLFVTWLLYAYRNLYPLLTYDLKPTDLDNAITWSRVGLLSFIAVLVPLFRPRSYSPADPRYPAEPDQVHPEQVTPWISLAFYSFLDSLVLKAWRVPSLPFEALHPLADYDRAVYLYKAHRLKIDPVRRQQSGLKSRHVFTGLLLSNARAIVIICLFCVISGATELSGSVGIQKVLEYLESDGEGQAFRPILWIALLFVGPTIGSLAIQGYVFLNTRFLVRSEAILTQLLFDHALRLRMKDSTDDQSDSADGKVPAINVENADAAAENGDSSDTEVGSSNGSGSGSKPAKKDNAAKAEEEAAKSNGQGLAGRINVLISSDVESILEGRDWPLILIYSPVQFALCTVLLYRILSWSSIIGMVTTILTLPLPGLLTKMNAQFQQKKMLATDVRIDSVTEAIGALRMIKMFGWEDRIKDRIAAKREDELNLIWKRRLINLSTTLLNLVLPVLTMSITFAFYTLVQKRELTASKVFTSMTVFEVVKGQMGMCFYLINSCVTAWVSITRINNFLHNSEMIDEFSEGQHAGIKPRAQLEAEEQGLIRLHDATFRWGTESGADTPGFRLRIPDLTFVKGKINLITGATGSGKSTLLKALTGELHFEKRPGAFFHLPREGGVSYAAQESWCMSESIKDNIIFGEPYDDARYRQVIHACGLTTDLTLFEDGDQTEIGEKGITMSGGQKARVTLARAVYSDTAIVLLDDIFSALDALTSRFIIDNLFEGELMRGRTVLLITHHVGLAAPMSDYMIALNLDGSLRSAGEIEDGVVPDEEIEQVAKEDIKETKEQISSDEPKVEEKKPTNSLVKEEEKSEGRISKKAMFNFFKKFGGPVFWLTYFGLLFGAQLMTAFQTYWLGLWAKAYSEADSHHPVSAVYWLAFYVVFVLVGLLMMAAAWILYYIGAIKASRAIHQRLVDRIFGAYARFLDTTPVGRIISRFSKDIKNIDGAFTETFADVAEITISLALKFVVVLALVPLFSLPAIAIGGLGAFIGEVYIHAQLSVKREMSNAKSPLFSHFSAAVSGIVSIRAYGAQKKLMREAQKRADKYTRTATAFYNLNRWVTVRIDMLGGLFASALAAFLIYGPRLDASTSGFALSQAISFSGMIIWWVRIVNELEVQGNSVERIEDYLVIDQEPAPTPRNEPPAAWPTSGEIVLDKVSAKYSADGPTVLDNLEVRIASGEKVGIVGRTGSGKSTLALAILRMIPTTGSVVIDGLKTENVNLKALRSNITIIPQDPILLSGSLRFNLDPFGEHDDAELNDAMYASGLGAVRHSESGVATPMRLSLDTQIAAGGGNLSQGQRQLVALARALVRNSKILILDEATASVDFETDALIQKSIRNLPSHCTVLTVAHRLATVMDYDKILVLGAGKLLEYDSPDVLRNNKDSYFAKLVQAMEGPSR